YELSEDGIPPRFTDDADIHGWAKESVYSCRFLGIVNGYKDGSFRPGNLTKRCEAAQIIYQLLVKYCDKITGLSMEEALGRATIPGVDGYDVGFPVALDGYSVRCLGAPPSQDTPKVGEIRVITCKEEMAEYIELQKDRFYYRDSYGGYVPVINLTDVLLSYDDDFFRENDIVIVRVSTSSGSFGVRYSSIDYRNGAYVFAVNTYRPTNGVYTCDIGYWCVWAIVSKGTINQNNITLEHNTIYY
ncbi:MAG: S-layer homology domain-containing protein, partial [Clostridia bacterium]|nr:S-layer homology domain-containing protein [Clostridia bacterium]